MDDCLLFAPEQMMLDNVISDLSKRYILQNEGDVSAYLGIQVTKDPKAKTITLSQPGLIKQLIQDIDLDGLSNGKDTPADGILYADTNGLPRCENWNYRSIIGKLNYLANNTRPDISMAVHQCTCFSSAPKVLHKLAVKCIVRYLSTTSDKGITLRPTTDLTYDMYVNSNFAGMWHKEYSHLRDNVLSRTGYMILFGGCPIMWASKLQTENALSTTENEYIALSSAARDLLPLRQILHDLDTYSFISIPKQTSSSINNSTLIASKIYEDNAACIVLATMTSNFKPRTKHIRIKWHHFRDQIKNGNLTILKVATDDNIADIFTKPLVKFKFEKLCFKLMGW
jgi:histone deacetylase 1/2